MPRTSLSHPLRIDELPIGNGLIGLTFCPGKQGDSLFGAPWERDLDLDIAAIDNWGADAALTLIEHHEFALLAVTGLPEAFRAAGIAWHHFPIKDLEVPDEAGLRDWRALSPELHQIIERGGKILIHCRGGLGRAGTMAALMLIERGASASAAIARVREARPGAIETEGQTRFLADQARHSGAQALRLHASLLGGAIGDSLGADIEFLSLPQIQRRFPNGLTDLPPHQGLRGAITDDTQMTLFTAEGIIRARIRGELKGISHLPSVVHHALLRWLLTQGDTAQMPLEQIGLVTDLRLQTCRAPGMTCLAALKASARFGDPAQNDSKGCGTIMRVAPIALMCRREAVRDLAIETSALTHGHPIGQYAASAWAEILADVALGTGLEHAASRIADDYAGIRGSDETAQAIRAALATPRDGRPETVEALGEGWIAEEALAIALYACLAGRGFEQALRIAVTHGGDSDSTGAMAGNLFGIMDPAAVLKHPWAEAVEGADLISRLVHDFDALSEGRQTAEDLWEYYPGV